MYDLLEKHVKKTATGQHPSAKPVVQCYRLVMPGQRIQYAKDEPNEAMFTTHRVEHFGVPQPLYVDGFNFQRPAAPVPGPVLPPATAALTGMNPAAFTSVMTAAQNASHSRLFNKDVPWTAYHAAVGAVSDPQLPMTGLGTNPYHITPPAAAPPLNTLTPASRFYTHELHTDTQVPMLVSHNTRFAVNALYPEPKEAYIAPADVAVANASFNHFGAQSMQLIPYGNRVTIDGHVLTMCRPQFDLTPAAPLNLLSPDTHACDDFKHHYFDYQHDRGLSTWNLDPVNTRVPWSMHYAGAILHDHYDTLSIENGARNAWITQRGPDAGPRAGYDQRRTDPSFQAQMNKTWYFRIYGTQKKGQDMASQLHARFT